ncbi:enoyl-CoA hydratase-related protein [Pseudooceanicola sp.]|uniref:enoyl-CoA hydratase/isomerase family protein n=1 Tax=Pseudooceanicola sp. TaxID=1914328 RepID=UPI002637AE83|nr:enoyl-CoA hydratase-related protein [Pseudooceanicola sp.]MDF1856489.1 enoyl-CoA hydratase-related protein [Pseudooceanicola sp.]
MPIQRHDDGGITRLTLDRPERMNAMDPEMREQLLENLMDIRSDPSRRALVITGAGGHFCTGADVQAMGERKRGFKTGRMMIRNSAHRYVALIQDLDIPVIASVPGHAAGVGWAIALAADVILAAPQARFTAAFVRIGLAPDGGLVWQLARALGQYAAKEIVLTGRTVEAEEAGRLGLVTRVVADGALETETQAMAERLASGPTLALAMAKRQFMAAQSPGFVPFLENEALMQPVMQLTEDNAEGIAAFREKRKAQFKGE